MCGHNNCASEFGKTGDFYDGSDDCCSRFCTPEKPCHTSQVKKNCLADENCMFGILNAYFRIFTICTSSEVLVLALVVESEPFKYTLWLCLGSGLSSG